MVFPDLSESPTLEEIEQGREVDEASCMDCHTRPQWAFVSYSIAKAITPLAPTIFEELVTVTGARSDDWSMRLDCCGNPLWGRNNKLSLDLMTKKLTNADQAGADCLGAACTYCQFQFDTVQEAELVQKGNTKGLPSILYPQLLGLSLGLPAETLGIEGNKIDISEVQNFLS